MDFNGQGTGFGYSCSPTVVGDKVVMPVGGQSVDGGAALVALNATTGDVVWSSGNQSASYTPALPIVVDGQSQVIAYMEHELVAFDLDTGNQQWNVKLSRGYDEHSAWPIYREPYLWIAAPFQKGSKLFRVPSNKSPSPDETAQPEVVWESSVMSNDVASSVLVDGYLYGFDLAEAQSKARRPSRGSFRCIDFTTGETMWSNGDPDARRTADWDENAKLKVIGQANVIAADGKLILFNDTGDLILARINPAEYVELGRCRLLGGEICWAMPSLDRGRVFLRNHSRAVCVYIGKPELIHSVVKQPTLSSKDLPQQPSVGLATRLGIQQEYAMAVPTIQWLNRWLVWTIGILMTVAVAAASLAFLGVPIRRCRVVFVLAAALGGLLAGPIASRLSGEFVFTLQLVVFAAFHAVAYRAKLRRSQAARTRTDRLVLVCWLLVCVGYYAICTRFGLVPQLAYLCGFFGATPALMIARRFGASERMGWQHTLELGFILLAYGGFHYFTVYVLDFVYELHAA